MRSKEVPRKLSCVTSDLKLECSIVHSRIQDVALQACGFTQATPTAKELNLQVLLRGTAAEMVVDIACLDTTGTVIAHLPAITRTITHDNKHSQAASFTKARTHACVLARQLQDSQSDIKELLTELADWQKVASETTAQLQQRDLQVADLQRQLKEPKPQSQLGLGSKHLSGPPKAEGTAQAASDKLGHLHTQVEGVESTIATLRAVVTEQEQQLRQQELQLQQQQQPADQYSQAALKLLKQQLKTSNVQLKQATSQLQEQKDQVMQLKREVTAQTGQADQAEARAASVQRAHDRVAQQLELAQTELRQRGSDVSAKVAETKQQAAQELQDAREQLQLHSQLLQEQDEEVQKLRKLLEVQHEQMTAQEQQQSQELNSLQECIREQQQHAAELQQRAARQEAEDVEQQKLVQKLSQHLLDAQQQVQQLTEQLQQQQYGKGQLLAAQQHSLEQAQLLLNEQHTCSRQEALLHDQQAVVSDLQQKLHDEQAVVSDLRQKLHDQQAVVSDLQQKLHHQQELSRQQEQSIADLTEQCSQLQQSVLQQNQVELSHYEQLQQTESDLEQLLTVQREQLRQQDSELQRQQQALDQREALLAQQQQQLSEMEGLRQEASQQAKEGKAAQQQAEDRLQAQTDLLQQQEQEMQQQSRLLMHHEGTLQRLQEQLSQASAKASAQADSSRMERLERMLLQLQTVLTSHVATVNQSPRHDIGTVAKAAVSEHHNHQSHRQPQLIEEAGQPERQLKQAESQMRQMKAELTVKKTVLREQRQELSHKDSLVSQCKEKLRGLTILVQQQRQELCTLERQATTQQQQASHHVHLLQKQQDALAEQSATVQKLQEQLGRSQEVTQAKQGELDSRSAELQQRQHVVHDQHAELRARSEAILQLQTDLQRLNSVVKQQQKEMAVTSQLVEQHQQLLVDKELFLSEQHEQLLQQDGLLRQQRELLVNQDTALQAYKGSASPRARWGHIHLQLAHRFAQARHRRHLSALLNHWLSFSRHRQHQQNKLQQFGVRRSRRVLLACIKGWAAAVQNRRMGHLLRHAEDAYQVACLKSIWHAWKGYSKQQGMYGTMITSSRRQHRQRSCRRVLHHWRSICTVRALLQQQGRAVTCSLQLLRLKQAWQLWRRAHRAALAARQRQYSKMVYELLKELESSETVLHGKEQACTAAQYEVASHRLQIEASRERLEGAKEEVGLSQEALLQEQQFTHHLQRQAREDIVSANEAVGAVAKLLQQLAPDGDVHVAALALRQAKETAAGMLRLPRSLAQWAQTPSPDPMQGQGSLPPSRLSQILLKHFHPAQADHTRPALLQSSIHASTGHADMHDARLQSHHAASTSANPRVGPYAALPFQHQSRQAKDNQRKPRHPAPAAAARQTTVTGSRAEQLAKPTAAARQTAAVGPRTEQWAEGTAAARQTAAVGPRAEQWAEPTAAAGRVSRGAAAKQRPQSAGSNAADTSKGKPALISKRKARPRSVSPGSQYHFSCTSSVSDNACSWFGHADTAMAQQGDVGKGRVGIRCPVQRPLWQTGADPGPVHTTYVVPHQLLMSPARNSHALRDQQVLPQKFEAQLHGQTGGFNSQGPQWLSDAVCDTWTRVQPADGSGPHAEQPQHQQQDYSHHQQQGLMSPPATPGGCSMAPPLEPPSTVQPAGVPRPPPILSPFMQRVARQMQLDAELLSHSQTHTQAQQQMLQRDAESLSVDHRHWLAHRAEGFAQQAQSHDVTRPMTDSMIGAGLHPKSMRALHKPEQGAQHGLAPQHEQASVRLAQQASTSQVSPAAASHLQSQVTWLASPPNVASVHTKGSQHTSRVLQAARIVAETSSAKGSSACQASQHAAESHASGQKSQTSRLSAVSHGQSSMHQQHSPASRQPSMQGARSKESCFLTPDASSMPAGALPSSQQASNSIGDGHCMGSVDSGKAVDNGAGIAGQHAADSNLALSNGLGTEDGVHQIMARPNSVKTAGPATTSEAAVKPSDHMVHAVHSMAASFERASFSSPEQSRMKKRKGRNSWTDHVPACWTDDSYSSCSSSSGTGPVVEFSGVQGVASESVMMPLELPSPMPCTSSEEGDEASADVFDAATGRPLSMDALSAASLQAGTIHASFIGFPDQTGTLLLHEEGSRSASLQGCGDAQLADQQDSKQLELLFNYERASLAQQPAAPRQNIQQQSSSSQLDPNDMHYFPSSPARQQNKSSAILQSRGNQRLAFVEGCSDQANQEQLHQKSVGGCALPVETCPQDTSEVIAGKARSSLKGSSAWPPPSPSPKKPLPSPKKPSAYPKKAACSQNRQPARSLQLQGVSQAATLQRHTDVMALRQRLRSRSSVSSNSQSRLDR